MTLIHAIRAARKNECKWLAIDADTRIIAYSKEPFIEESWGVGILTAHSMMF